METTLLDILDNYIEDKNGCHIWQGSFFKSGYPSIYYNGKNFRGNRLVYDTYVGPIPVEYCVLHDCDNPACINPNHLTLGTHQDNMSDKVSKGRQYKSTRDNHPNTKLTDNDCSFIYRKFQGDYGEIKALSKLWGVNRNTITQALKRGKQLAKT